MALDRSFPFLVALEFMATSAGDHQGHAGHLPVSIVIPTYGRDQTLIDTLSSVLPCCRPGDEVLVVDQTIKHDHQTELILSDWSSRNTIRWIRKSNPSIPEAMNEGMKMAGNPLVLFLDDDILPVSRLVQSHSEAHTRDNELWATVGQVIQPWQQSVAVEPPRRLTGLREDFDFPFYSSLEHDLTNVMAGNLCVHRERALSLGGFDENFQGSAYRFETEFARRVKKAGGRIRFVGTASIKHLRVPTGGTRKAGSHLKSASPQHGMGDHYYAFLHGGPIERWTYSIGRVVREVCTRFHATHPWWIPVKITGELRAMYCGWKMAIGKMDSETRRVASSVGENQTKLHTAASSDD